MSAVTFHLDTFDGPLDLLLHLISKNKVDICDIPIAKILEQYLDYLKQMREFDMNVASEFITMAAQLMYIKSKMLLPVYEEEGEVDPREDLARALLEYQQFKLSAEHFKTMSEIGRDLFVKTQEVLEKQKREVVYEYNYDVLIKAIENIFERSQQKLPPPVSAFQGIVGREPVPVEDKISQLVVLLSKSQTINFEKFVLSSTSRSEIVAIFLAVLELSKAHKVMIEDSEQGYMLRLADIEEQNVWREEDAV